MRKFLLFFLLAFGVGLLAAQTTPPPNIIASSPGLPVFDPTPAIVAVAQSSTWNVWADSSLTSLGQHLAVDETALQTANSQITALQGQLAQAQADIAILKQLVAALTPVPPQVVNVSVDLTALPAGPLASTIGGINWNSGMWSATSAGVSASCVSVAGVSSCPPRQFTLPPLANGTSSTLVSITIRCTQSCAFTLTDSAGETIGPMASAPQAGGSVVTYQASWTKPSGAITLTMQSGPANTVALVNLVYN
jgi:hypothetical protein